MHSVEEATAFVELFVATPFSQDPRHKRRIAMLTDFEATGELPPRPCLPEPSPSQRGERPAS